MSLLAKLLGVGRVSDHGRRDCPVQLHDLWVSSSFHGTSARAVLGEVVKPTRVDSLWRLEEGPLYPHFYDSGPEFVELLRGLVMHLRPSVVVETGVAHGRSTRGILEALANNHSEHPETAIGALHSIEVDPRTNAEDLRKSQNWNFHLLNRDLSFTEAMSKIGAIDMFVHDSDHGYENQLMEYRAAWEALRPGGVLVSDDVSWSWAFHDFCKDVKRSPILLFEAPKVAGLLVRP